jgi:hypothetical protein
MKAITICSMTILSLLVGMPAQSQSPQQNQQQNHDPIGSIPDKLKEKVSLPNVPEYTGKAKYLHGLIYPAKGNEKQGPTYVMCFNAKETMPQVHDWWLTSMRQYSWNISYTTSDVIRGTDKNGSFCIIQIGPPVAGVAKDDRSSFEIRFQEAK